MGKDQIDRARLRAEFHKMKRGEILAILEKAVALLPDDHLPEIVRDRLNPDRLRADGRRARAPGFLEEVKAFYEASRRGEFYEEFMVNWRNCMEMSSGTENWISECERLLDRMVVVSENGDPSEVCQAMNLILDLLDRIDECEPIIFFADEHGSWQVGISWRRVLPAWFRSFAATAKPAEYAKRVVEIIDRHEHHDRDRHLEEALSLGTPAQRKALKALLHPRSPRWTRDPRTKCAPGGSSRSSA